MKKTVLFLLLVSVLLLFVSCGNTTTEVTTEDVPVTQAPTTISNPYVFYEPTPTTHSGVDADGNR